MNTILKPTIKAAEFSITLPNNWPSFDLSPSTPAPEISDTYPGTRGSTHGDKNEISPATKAAIGRGRLDIEVILPVLPESVLSSQNKPMPEGTQMLQKSSGSQVEKSARAQSCPLWRLFC